LVKMSSMGGGGGGGGGRNLLWTVDLEVDVIRSANKDACFIRIIYKKSLYNKIKQFTKVLFKPSIYLRKIKLF
jgi:hypothetical protein